MTRPVSISHWNGWVLIVVVLLFIFVHMDICAFEAIDVVVRFRK